MKSLKNIFALLLFISFSDAVYSFSFPDSTENPEYQWTERHYISHNLINGELSIETDHGLVQAIPYSSKIVEIKYFPDNLPVNDSSEAVIMAPELTTINLTEDNQRLYMNTGNLTVVFNKDPFYATFVYMEDTLLREEKGFFERDTCTGLRFKLNKEEKLYGLGERAVDNSLRGEKYQLYNQAQYGYTLGAENLNFSVPLVISSKKYLLFYDNYEKGYADLGKEEKSVMEWGSIGGLVKYFFIAGDDFRDISSQWGELTGKQPLPPIWALGNLQSRMGYRSQKQVEDIVKLMQKNDFPLDAIIIDLYWFGDSILGNMGHLEWDKTHWPKPENMISNLNDKGIRTVLITEPYVIDTLKNFYEGDSLGIFTTDSTGKTYINKGFYFGPAGLIDIFKPAAQKWFWSKYKPLAEEGVSGWWGDLGEPEYHPADEYHITGKAEKVHNIYAHTWHKMLFESYRKDFPEQRLFNLNRSGYAGSQRYSIFPWTGDVSRSWGGLQAQLPALLNASLSGLPYTHSDAGGFAGDNKDEELYTRWMQFACFTPVLRPHGFAGDTEPEPVFYSEKTQDIVRRYIKLRYSLLPYIYTLSAQASLKGYPLMRPLFYEFPDDWEAFDYYNEYMFGNNILVAPVIKQGQKVKTVYLPRGTKWYNFHTNRKFPGGNEYDIDLKINDIPLFVKGGSFIPTTEPVNTTKDYNTNNLIIKYYVGDDEKRDVYLMYSDDNKDPESIKNKNFETLMFVQKKNENNGLEFMFSRINGYAGMPEKRNIRLEITGLPYVKEKRFLLNGQDFQKKKKDAKGNGYFFDDSRKVWVLDFVWDVPDTFITEAK